jgi:tRNA-Thr(GGU) m(6)t(6)A37 methyltransferase TsaA
LPEYAQALEGIGDRRRLLVLTWMDRADRGLLKIIPCGIKDSGLTGVLNTRTPNRPNPIGLCNVELLGVSGLVLTVRGLDSLDGTPVIDIKPFVKGLDG